MKQQADVNVIITELDASSPTETVVDYETDPLEFHRVNMGLNAKSDADSIVEDAMKFGMDNTDSSLNTLYGIGDPQDSRVLHRVVEVLSLLRWSKDQATALRRAGTLMYDALPTIPTHGDPLVVTLLLRGRLQPHLLVDEGLAVNILFKCSIVDLKVEECFAPPEYPIVGFGNNRIRPLGAIELPISFVDGDKIVNVKANFLIINTQATFDGIIGRPLMHAVNALPSSCYQLLFFKAPTGAGVVYDDQTVGRELMQIEYDRLTTRDARRMQQ